MSTPALIEDVPETPEIKAAVANLLAEIRKAKKAKRPATVHSGTFADHKESRAAATRLASALTNLFEKQGPKIVDQLVEAYAKATGK